MWHCPRATDRRASRSGHWCLHLGCGLGSDRRACDRELRHEARLEGRRLNGPVRHGRDRGTAWLPATSTTSADCCLSPHIDLHPTSDLAALTVALDQRVASHLRVVELSSRMPAVGERLAVVGYPKITMDGQVHRTRASSIDYERDLSISQGQVVELPCGLGAPSFSSCISVGPRSAEGQAGSNSMVTRALRPSARRSSVGVVGARTPRSIRLISP